MAGLSARLALFALRLIDRSTDAFCTTAPAAVESFGGRATMQAHSQMTCIVPVRG